ncbi:MAG TPA: hypothetical protein VF764_13445, partial [Steroidobacteraceae bacterium]
VEVFSFSHRGPREIVRLVERWALIWRRKRDFVGWFTGAPAKSRILFDGVCSPDTASAISWGGVSAPL